MKHGRDFVGGGAQGGEIRLNLGGGLKEGAVERPLELEVLVLFKTALEVVLCRKFEHRVEELLEVVFAGRAAEVQLEVFEELDEVGKGVEAELVEHRAGEEANYARPLDFGLAAPGKAVERFEEEHVELGDAVKLFDVGKEGRGDFGTNFRHALAEAAEVDE